MVSGLPLPRTAPVVIWTDQWPQTFPPRGGYSTVTLELSSTQFQAAVRAARTLGYRPLPVPPQFAFLNDQPQDGWYRVQGDVNHDFALVVLDADHHRVTVVFWDS